MNTEKINARKTLFRLLGYFEGHGFTLFLLALLVIVASFFSTFPLMVIKNIIDLVTRQAPGDWVKLGAHTLLFLSLHVLGVLTSRGLNLISSWIEGHLGHKIRTDAYSHVQILSLNFHESNRTGEKLSRLIGDAEVTVQGVLEPVTMIARVSVTFSFAIFFMVNLDWKLAVIGIPAGLIAGVILTCSGNVLRRCQLTAREATDLLWSKLIENLRGMRDIQAYNQQARVLEDIKIASNDVRSKVLAANFMDSIIGGINDVMFTCTMALILFVGGYRALHGKISYGTLTAFMMYAHMLIDPAAELASLYRRLQRIVVSADRIFRIFDETPEVLNKRNAVQLDKVRGLTQFENVSFVYERDHDVLKKISFVLKPGERVVLVGPSGGGKTTIVKLLARFYDPAEGQILLDGHDLKDIQLESLREHIGVLFQDVFLFDDTIEANIRFGAPDASSAAVYSAAVEAGLRDLIESLEDGLLTRIGEDGVKLSGGERQRVGLARVLLKNPSIVVLDEPTASLDTVTTAEIVGRLERTLRRHTTLIIAHQLGTMVGADRIMYLANGIIAEQGNHEELYGRKGAYRTMYDAQFRSVS